MKRKRKRVVSTLVALTLFLTNGGAVFTGDDGGRVIPQLFNIVKYAHADQDNYYTRDDFIFEDNGKTLAGFSASGIEKASNNSKYTLNLPNGPTKIKEYAFACEQFGNERLFGKIILPNTLTIIGNGAFRYNYFTGNIKLPKSLEKIGDDAFVNAKFNNEDLVLPDYIESIGQHAFHDSKFTGTIKLSQRLRRLYSWSFYNSEFTGTLELPSNMKILGSEVFRKSRFNKITHKRIEEAKKILPKSPNNTKLKQIVQDVKEHIKVFQEELNNWLIKQELYQFMQGRHIILYSSIDIIPLKNEINIYIHKIPSFGTEASKSREYEDANKTIARISKIVNSNKTIDITDEEYNTYYLNLRNAIDDLNSRIDLNKKIITEIQKVENEISYTGSSVKKQLLISQREKLKKLRDSYERPKQKDVDEAIKRSEDIITLDPNQLALQDAKDKLTQISTTAKTNKAKTEANTLLQQIAKYDTKPDSITDEVAKDITDKTDTLQQASTKADATLTQIKVTIPDLQARLEKEIDTTEKEAIKAIITRVNDAENIKEYSDLDTLLQDINTLLKKQTVTDKKIKELQELLKVTKNQIEKEKITKILQDLNSTKPKTTLAQVDEIIKVVTENNKKYNELDNLIKDINNELNNPNLPKEKKEQLEKLKKHLENMRDGYLDNTTTQDIKDQKEKTNSLIGSNPNADKAKSIIKNLEEKRAEVEKDITGTQELENLDNLIKDLKDKTKDPKAPELTDDYLMQIKDKIDQVKKNATTRQKTNRELQTKIDEINKALQSTKGSKKKDLLNKAKDSLSALKAQKPTPTSQDVNEAKKLADTAISTKDDTPSTGGTTPSKPNTGSGSGGNTGSTGSSSSSGGGGGSSYHSDSYGGGGRGGSYSNKQQQRVNQQTNQTKPQDNQTTPQQNPAPNKSEQKITFKDVPFAKGTGNNSFNPNKNLSKAEAIQMVMNVLEVKGYKVENSKAYDGKWYANTVNLAITTGILKDDSDLDSPLTRENFTNLIAELEKIMTGNKTLQPKESHFQDTNSPIINYFYEKNVVSGKSADKFNPNDNLTRAEAVAILNRLQGKQLKGNAKQIYNDVPPTHWAFTEIYKASVDM